MHIQLSAGILGRTGFRCGVAPTKCSKTKIARVFDKICGAKHEPKENYCNLGSWQDMDNDEEKEQERANECNNKPKAGRNRHGDQNEESKTERFKQQQQQLNDDNATKTSDACCSKDLLSQPFFILRVVQQLGCGSGFCPRLSKSEGGAAGLPRNMRTMHVPP